PVEAHVEAVAAPVEAELVVAADHEVASHAVDAVSEPTVAAAEHAAVEAPVAAVEEHAAAPVVTHVEAVAAPVEAEPVVAADHEVASHAVDAVSEPTVAAAEHAAVEAPVAAVVEDEVSVSTSTESAVLPLWLRIRAVGGQNLEPKGGIAGVLERMPDPYVTIVMGSETKVMPVAKKVNAKEFFWGDNAVCEYAWPRARVIDMKIHVKDKDIAKDRYLGGAKLSLHLDEIKHSHALTKTISLEFSDKQFQTKKGVGQIFLSFERVGAHAKHKKQHDEKIGHEPKKPGVHHQTTGSKKKHTTDKTQEGSSDGATIQSGHDEVPRGLIVDAKVAPMPPIGATPTDLKDLKEDVRTNDTHKTEGASPDL
ncbi:hypothetical protein As57867_003988, partial [Aphanomyces stellatus]